MSLLEEILKAQGVAAPTGAPLYRYRLDARQRSRLEDRLSEHCRNWRTFEGAEALFCLYAADRFRTHADGDVWCWATVTDPIGWRGPYSELQRGVLRGLRWWRRPLFETAKGRRFLATLVNEGGGPLGLLSDARTGASLKLFLRRLLVDRERFRRPAGELVATHLDVLARSLQHETAIEVLTALVDHVAELRARLRTAGTTGADPVATLDRIDRGWRDRFVLDLGDSVASELLKGLLREPAPAVSAACAVPTVETRLEGEGSFTLAREVVLPTAPEAAAFLASFGYVGDAPGRVRLLREAADGTLNLVAVGYVRGGDAATYAFERAAGARILDAETVTRAVSLVAMAGARELGRMVPAGGDALEEGPWIFSPERPRKMLGVAPLRTRHPKAFVVLPEEACAVDAAKAETWHEVGDLRTASARRSVFELKGTLRVAHAETDDTITTSSAEDDDRLFLQGRAWSGPGTFSEPVFHGLPSVWSIDAEGVMRRASEAQLMWRRDGSTSLPAHDRSVGRGRLEVQRRSAIVLRRRAVIVPKDLAVEVKVTRDDSQGELTVSSYALSDVGVEPVEGLIVTSDRALGRVTLKLLRTRTDLDGVTLVLRIREVGDLRLRMPFPARRRGFVRGFDTAVPSGARCALERLSQLRAVGRGHLTTDRFQLMARVKGGTPWLPLASLPRDESSRGMVLDAVAEDVSALLSLTEAIDDGVELGVLCVGNDAAPRERIFVGRYERWLDPERDEEGCSLALRQSDVTTACRADELRIEARRLLEPQADPVVIEREGEGWRVRWEALSPGPWMVLAWRDDRLAVRPILFTAPRPGDSVMPVSEGLRGAASTTPTAARFEALARRFDEMVCDPFVTDWELVDDHIATLQAVPASTFDVVRGLVRNEVAAIIALLRAPDALRPVVWSAFETLPFLWETVAVASWVKALASIRARWPEQSGALDPRGFVSWFDDVLGFLESRGRMAKVQIELAAAALDLRVRDSTLEHAQGNPQFCAMLRVMLDAAAVAVRQRHDGEHWPEAELRERDLAEQLPRRERLTGHDDAQELVIHAPLIAAMLSAGRALQIDESTPNARTTLRVSLRRARGFDPNWFDEAASYWLARLMTCSA